MKKTRVTEAPVSCARCLAPELHRQLAGQSSRQAIAPPSSRVAA
jgi:hypothetical protein